MKHLKWQKVYRKLGRGGGSAATYGWVGLKFEYFSNTETEYCDHFTKPKSQSCMETMLMLKLPFSAFSNIV